MTLAYILIAWGILAGASYSWMEGARTPLPDIQNNTLRRLAMLVLLPWTFVVLVGLCVVLAFDAAVKELQSELKGFNWSLLKKCWSGSN